MGNAKALITLFIVSSMPCSGLLLSVRNFFIAKEASLTLQPGSSEAWSRFEQIISGSLAIEKQLQIPPRRVALVGMTER
jgi:hypothetical protein